MADKSLKEQERSAAMAAIKATRNAARSAGYTAGLLDGLRHLEARVEHHDMLLGVDHVLVVRLKDIRDAIAHVEATGTLPEVKDAD